VHVISVDCVAITHLQDRTSLKHFIDVTPVTQACCEPVLHSITEIWGMPSAQTCVAVHFSWLPAYLYEEQISIDIIAVTQACCEPVLRSNTETWGITTTVKQFLEHCWPCAIFHELSAARLHGLRTKWHHPNNVFDTPSRSLNRAFGRFLGLDGAEDNHSKRQQRKQYADSSGIKCRECYGRERLCRRHSVVADSRQRRRGLPFIAEGCTYSYSYEAIPWEGQTGWQNRPAVLPSIQFFQQSNRQKAAAVCPRWTKRLLSAQAFLATVMPTCVSRLLMAAVGITIAIVGHTA